MPILLRTLLVGRRNERRKKKLKSLRQASLALPLAYDLFDPPALEFSSHPSLSYKLNGHKTSLRVNTRAPYRFTWLSGSIIFSKLHPTIKFPQCDAKYVSQATNKSKLNPLFLHEFRFICPYLYFQCLVKERLVGIMWFIPESLFLWIVASSYIRHYHMIQKRKLLSKKILISWPSFKLTSNLAMILDPG